ncbi:MAG TPA: tetratricopeptide repeat protein [Blastocatellia bacterium]|nr:tetratricopeptide repeat protein [Blastocatellia bacterium]
MRDLKRRDTKLQGLKRRETKCLIRLSLKRAVPALLLLGSFFASPGVEARAADWAQAVTLYQKGDYRAALGEFQAVIKDQPDAAGAWYYIGICEFKLKRYKQAELPLSHAIDLLEVQSPGSEDISGAWYTIGFSHYLVGEFDKAVDSLKNYIDIQAKAGRKIDANARRALGRSYFFLDRYDEAMPLLAEAKPGDVSSDQAGDANADSYYIGAIYFKKGDDDRAVKSLQTALEAKPGDVAAMDLLAESLIRKAQSPKTSSANEYWLKAAECGENLKKLSDDLTTASILGRAYFGARDFEKALPSIEKVAKAKPDDGQWWLYYGIALSRTGQTRKAEEALEMTIQLTPNSIPALSELAYVYESNKQYDQALRVYEKAYAAGGSADASIKQSIDRVRALGSPQH